jgi:hypothetical protein
MKMVIPSKGRGNSVASKTLKLFPDAWLCVGESEAQEYEDATKHKNILTHPDSVTGIGPLRNWIINNVKDNTVVMLDDDIDCIYEQSRYKRNNILNPAHCMAILERTAIASNDAGCKLFGFAQMPDPRNYYPYKPIVFHMWIGGVIGVHGKTLQWDQNLILRADIDACLQSLLKDRILWVDNRYSFCHKRFEGKGGNNTNRTAQRHKKEIAELKTRWGGYIQEKKAQGVIRLQVKVKR